LRIEKTGIALFIVKNRNYRYKIWFRTSRTARKHPLQW
jgi:hypothetical protein